MAINTGNKELDDRLNYQLVKLASGGFPEGNLLSAAARISEAVFHDFSNYRFLLPPYFMSQPSPGLAPGSGLEVVGLGTLMEFDKFVALFKPIIGKTLADWFTQEGSKMELGGYDSSRPSMDVSDDEVRIAIEGNALSGFRTGMAPELFKLYMSTAMQEPFLIAAYNAVAGWLAPALRQLSGPDNRYKLSALLSVDQTDFWHPDVATVALQLKDFITEPVANEEGPGTGSVNLPDFYPFEPFKANSVNYGLQIIYRQAWVPLGTQPGEIVRTLPLGPKQSEKISFKVIRRTKATRQMEISTSIETATESSAATKDSSEVVQEASEKSNWHVEASASASWGFGSAELKAGGGGENASASKNAKSQINDTMEKTASKIRKDTKIVVSTEVEQTSEFSQMSEITNPNDEIAVTYIYSRLQRQYELRTYLSEVNQVVFVAERIPTPNEITGPWIRRYDWIIAKELLDDSFRNDLEVLRNYERKHPESDQIDQNIQRLMETLSGTDKKPGTGIPDYKTLQGYIPDLFQNQQGAYEREIERKRSKAADQEQYQRSELRLREHIYDNILHYCRAIWSSEDPDARILRYQQIRVPIKWEFAATGAGPDSIQGYFIPAVTSIEDDTVSLSELVNPAGPIGFAGNYAVFYLKQSVRWATLLQMIGFLQLPYLTFEVRIERNGLNQNIKLVAAAPDNITGPGRFRCTFGYDPNNAPMFSIDRHVGSYWEAIGDVLIKDETSIIFPTMPKPDATTPQVRLWLSGLANFVKGDSFEIVFTIRQGLEDPEIKALRWAIPPLEDTQKAGFFSPAVISAMREYFTDVFLAFQGSAPDISWEKSSVKQQTILASRYYDYLLRSQHTRRIMLDTNNLLLTREVDSATTLEPFKGLHRVIDVLKANEEFNQVRLENERKLARLAAKKLGDPDIEKLTVIAAAPGVADLAAVDGLITNESDGG